ncbi:hypothetical protein F5Y01DRAFT_316795 [Xylaria sp. FL0043]|nr:hypothetical protein F5Y01DRAFT_316795 [Xylaria sp. FL0043]
MSVASRHFKLQYRSLRNELGNLLTALLNKSSACCFCDRIFGTRHAQDLDSPVWTRRERILNGNGIESERTTTVETLATSTRINSTSQVKRGNPMTSIHDRTESISVSQNALPWHGGWTPGAVPWPEQWGRIPTTVITLASTVTYTESSPTAKASQSSSQDPTASGIRPNGLDISGPVAAGIGVGASIGLLGLCLVVGYLYRKRSHRRRRISSPNASGSEKNNDGTWPPYLYSASNESPVELSTARQPKEMCGETMPRGKNMSNHSGIVELDGGGLVIR